MGHLLSSINPEAAAAIRPALPDVQMPRVGDTLRFYPIPGNGRAGNAEQSVLVTRVHDDARIDGVVIYDASDFRDVANIPPRTPTHIHPSWEFTRDPEAVTPADAVNRLNEVAVTLEDIAERGLQYESLVRQLTSRVDGLVSRINALEAAAGRAARQAKAKRPDETPATAPIVGEGEDA